MNTGPARVALLGCLLFAGHSWSQPPRTSAQVDLAIEKRDYRAAESLLLDAINDKPDSPELLTALARVFFLDRRYLNCATAMEKAAKLGRLSERDRITLALAYIEIGHSDWARGDLKEIATANPRSAAAHYWLGRIDYEDQRFVDAQARFQKAIELDPSHVRAYDYLALCIQALGKYEEAAEAFREAIRINRVNPAPSAWPSFDFASMLMLTTRFKEAEPYLRESIKYDPSFAKAHYRLGVLLEKQANVSEAVEELQRAAALDQSYPEPLYALARLYRQEGRATEAAAALAGFEARTKRVQAGAGQTER